MDHVSGYVKKASLIAGAALALGLGVYFFKKKSCDEEEAPSVIKKIEVEKENEIYSKKTIMQFYDTLAYYTFKVTQNLMSQNRKERRSNFSDLKAYFSICRDCEKEVSQIEKEALNEVLTESNLDVTLFEKSLQFYLMTQGGEFAKLCGEGVKKEYFLASARQTLDGETLKDVVKELIEAAKEDWKNIKSLAMMAARDKTLAFLLGKRRIYDVVYQKFKVEEEDIAASITSITYKRLLTLEFAQDLELKKMLDQLQGMLMSFMY